VKLHDVARGSLVRVRSNPSTPPAAPLVERGEVLWFEKMDGMYGVCLFRDGLTSYLAAWTDVDDLGTMAREDYLRSGK
jgi:hypothetical protein